MEVKEIMTLADVRKKIREHLKTTLDKEDFSIDLAIQDKNLLDDKDVWRINVGFVDNICKTEFRVSASFTIDAITGEVKEFWKGRTWIR